jgi:hypothetical protein
MLVSCLDYRIYACIGRTFFFCLKFKLGNGARLIFEITSQFILKKLYSLFIISTPEIIFQQNYFFYNFSLKIWLWLIHARGLCVHNTVLFDFEDGGYIVDWLLPLYTASYSQKIVNMVRTSKITCILSSEK